MGIYSQNLGQRPKQKTFRPLPQAPEKILDAPEMVDDYYLNLLDWGSSNTVSLSIPCLLLIDAPLECHTAQSSIDLHLHQR